MFLSSSPLLGLVGHLPLSRFSSRNRQYEHLNLICHAHTPSTNDILAPQQISQGPLQGRKVAPSPSICATRTASSQQNRDLLQHTLNLPSTSVTRRVVSSLSPVTVKTLRYILLHALFPVTHLLWLDRMWSTGGTTSIRFLYQSAVCPLHLGCGWLLTQLQKHFCAMISPADLIET